MSGDTIHQAPRRHRVSKIRVHDYLYDSAFIVSGARDYARSSFQAAMSSAQLVIQPVFTSMFSELRKRPRINVVYHPNCRLPDHMDRSYGAYVERTKEVASLPLPQLGGKDRFKFSAFPKKVLLPLHSATPEFLPVSPKSAFTGPTKPRNKGTQSVYRESSAQTHPWQPDSYPNEFCETTPEVMYLKKLNWGPGCPYRNGDLPADFHTTEVINKMRHARMWMEIVEKSKFPRWMKKGDAIITEIETKDWIFREAEIDELQEIRLTLLQKIQKEQNSKQTRKMSRKLAKLWTSKKMEMERKVNNIRRNRDRELRKLAALHASGGQAGLVQRMRAARGHGSITLAAHDPTSDLHAPAARHGYQARRRHAEITYDPSLLALEDHKKLSEPPAWLQQCGQNLQLSCSGHRLPRDPLQLCERETKWSEQFLENMHNDLKKARLGAASASAGPLHVLKPRRAATTPRPTTPEVEGVHGNDETCHQAALQLQKVIRGRAVQCLMYEGRTRASELTEELKTTHGLQKEDQTRIDKEESKARNFSSNRDQKDQKDDAVTALVDELCGSAVSAALDFLEKELRRLKEERRQHAFILIALREKQMREAAEAGRRQKEEHRRREHDEMFKQLLGVTQETVDVYLQEVIEDGIQLVVEEESVARAKQEADNMEESMREHASMSTAEQNELVAELVHQFLLPEANRTASRLSIAAKQAAKLEEARATIFGLIDDAEIKDKLCTQCGMPLDELCRCRYCSFKPQIPVETEHRYNERWKASRVRTPPLERSIGERFPIQYEMRRLLDTLVDEGVLLARSARAERDAVSRECAASVRHRLEAALDAREFVDNLFDRATGEYSPPPRDYSKYRHIMLRSVGDALDRTEPFPKRPCPEDLPSEIRRRADEDAAKLDHTCHCEESSTTKVQFEKIPLTPEKQVKVLPSALRELEEMRRCKCDTPAVSSVSDTDQEEVIYTDGTETTGTVPEGYEEPGED